MPWIDDDYRMQMEKDRENENLAFYLHCPHGDPMTEEDFDQIEGETRRRHEEQGDAHEDVNDLVEAAWRDAACKVIPEEWFRVWYGRYPIIYDAQAHSPEHNHLAAYYIDKALACGFAKTAEEAVRYFEDNG